MWIHQSVPLLKTFIARQSSTDQSCDLFNDVKVGWNVTGLFWLKTFDKYLSDLAPHMKVTWVWFEKSYICKVVKVPRVWICINEHTFMCHNLANISKAIQIRIADRPVRTWTFLWVMFLLHAQNVVWHCLAEINKPFPEKDVHLITYAKSPSFSVSIIDDFANAGMSHHRCWLLKCAQIKKIVSNFRFWRIRWWRGCMGPFNDLFTCSCIIKRGHQHFQTFGHLN